MPLPLLARLLSTLQMLVPLLARTMLPLI